PPEPFVMFISNLPELSPLQLPCQAPMNAALSSALAAAVVKPAKRPKAAINAAAEKESPVLVCIFYFLLNTCDFRKSQAGWSCGSNRSGAKRTPYQPLRPSSLGGFTLF